MSKLSPVDILLVEDNAGDIMLVRQAFADAKIANTLHVTKDGVEAMTFLHDPDMPRPKLILLDLNLPRKSGREVLAEVKSDTALRSIPIVIMTSSKAEEDIAVSYDLQANCYITKPVDFLQLVKIIKAIDQFWLNVVRLPEAKDIL